VSLAAVASRVEELSALIQRPVGAGAASPSSASAFSAQMQAALTSASPAATTAVDASGTLAGGGETAYDDLITAAAQRHGIDPALLKGLIKQESGFDPNAG